MNWNECVDLMLCMNLGTREDRRLTAWTEFMEHGLEVERFPAVNKSWLKHLRGYESSGRRACGLSKRLAIRQAMRRCKKGLLLLEDDAVLHPEFAGRIRELPLPDDWAMLYLGCQHLKRPQVVAPGLVRIRRASSMHAVIIRAGFLRQSLSAMQPGAGGLKVCFASDLQLAELQKTLPVYAPWPNLAWQRDIPSGIEDPSRPCTYLPTGAQRWCPAAVAGLDQEMEEFMERIWCHEGETGIWMHPDEWAAVTSRLTPDDRVLEWGSGGSTTALAQRVREVVSIEHDEDFAEVLTKSGFPVNVSLHVIPPEFGQGKIWEALPGQFTNYIRKGGECGVFDAVLVDGRARVDCALEAARSGALQRGGWLFLHDWKWRPRYTTRLSELEPWFDLVAEIDHTKRGMAVFRRK